MPKAPSTSTFRISGLPKNYPFTSWIQESLQNASEPLSYFSFANHFNNTEQVTNSHYRDLLASLSSQDQTKKLIGCAQKAKTKFDKRNKSIDNPGFAQEYQKYWKERNKRPAHEVVSERQQETIIRLNDLACQQIENTAQEIHNGGSSSSVTNVLHHSKQLSSDKVGHLDILDLSSETVTDMLHDELSRSEFDIIMQNRTLPPYTLSAPAQNMLIKIENAQPESGCIRAALYEVAAHLGFKLVIHHDLGFIEKTVRHFMDLIDSPRNPLCQPAKERTAAINTIIFIVNELFISNNDILELDWIENEYCQTSRAKWDGVLIKVDNKTVSVALVEFSGGSQFNATSKKEVSDINKLYENLKVMIENIPESIPSKVYCVRYYDNNIYFEHLFKHQNKHIRHIDCSFRCPTTIRLIKSFIKEIPKLLQWKDAVVNQTLEYDE